MKKTLVALFLLLGLLILSSCGGNVDTDTDTETETIDCSTETDIETADSLTDTTTDTADAESDTETETDTETDTETNTENTNSDNDTVDTSIKVEYDEDREKNDNEFTFDEIIIDRRGYDVIVAGKYYGNDFDNVEYYGSYYRIIDNHDDFSELTQLGTNVDKSVFEDNFVLVLHTYKNYYKYYSISSTFYKLLNGKGDYLGLKLDSSSNKLKIEEEWMINSGSASFVPIEPNGNIISQSSQSSEIGISYTIFPADIHETIYLLISKDELPNDISINGEIDLNQSIYFLE